jgi:hypothetical protein
VQQRCAGPWQTNHDQRPRRRRIEQAWPAAELVLQPRPGDLSPDQLAAEPDPPQRRQRRLGQVGEQHPQPWVVADERASQLAGRPSAHLLLVQPPKFQACSLFGEPSDHHRRPDPGGRAEAVTLAHRCPAFRNRAGCSPRGIAASSYSSPGLA